MAGSLFDSHATEENGSFCPDTSCAPSFGTLKGTGQVERWGRTCSSSVPTSVLETRPKPMSSCRRTATTRLWAAASGCAWVRVVWRRRLTFRPADSIRSRRPRPSFASVPCAPCASSSVMPSSTRLSIMSLSSPSTTSWACSCAIPPRWAAASTAALASRTFSPPSSRSIPMLS